MNLSATQELLNGYWKQGYLLSTTNPDVKDGHLITRNLDSDDQLIKHWYFIWFTPRRQLMIHGQSHERLMLRNQMVKQPRKFNPP